MSLLLLALLFGCSRDEQEQKTVGDGAKLVASTASALGEGGACRAVQRIMGSGLDICAELAGGKVDCWGDASQNFGTSGPTMLVPTPEPALTGARSFGNSFFHSCVVQANGSIRCWGKNDHGQLGDGTNVDKPNGVLVSNITNATRVWVLPYSTCALLEDSAVMCWGNNGWGQLGDGTTTASNVPKRVVNIGPVLELTVNSTGVFALLADHTVKYWGQVYNGALGGIRNTSTPVAVPALDGAVQVSLAFDHMCALMNDGTVKCAGNNTYGALGNGTFTAAATPAVVPGLTSVKKVGAGYTYTCAILTDGTARCWGFGGHAALGRTDLTQAQAASPNVVPGISGATDLVTMGFNSCVSLNGCAVECWGQESGMGIGTAAVQSPRIPRMTLLPTELNSLVVADACRLPSDNEGIFIANNTASVAVDSPLGKYNQFSDGVERHQPTTYAPGPTAARVQLPASGTLTWTLGSSQKRIDSTTPECSVTTGDGHTQINVAGRNYTIGRFGLVDVCRIATDPSAAVSPGDALFLYENTNLSTIVTTLGTDNQFDPIQDRGQPRSFPPGTGTFRVQMSEAGDTWSLANSTLTADSTIHTCQIVEKGNHDEVVLDGKTYSVPPTSPALPPGPWETVGIPFTGTLSGNFSVSATGAATYSLPLQVPPGIQGVVPTLALNYDSQGDNGIAGQGWSLSGLSAVYRCAKTIHQDGRSLPIDEEADDVFCIDGNRLFLNSDGTFRTEAMDFSKISVTRDQFGRVDSFRVETKAGMTHRYGSRPESWFRNQTTNRIDVWGLDEVRDLSNNYFLIHYNEAPEIPSDGLLATSIEYTGHGEGSQGPFQNKILLQYENRPDQRMPMFAGGPMVKKRRLRSIETGAGHYNLGYLADKVGSPSRLANIRYCSSTSVAGICTDFLSFNWSEEDLAWSTAEDGSGDYQRYFVGPNLVGTYKPDGIQPQLGYQFVDLDADGLTDLLAGSASQGRLVYHNRGSAGDGTPSSGWERRDDWGLPDDHGGVSFSKDDGSDAGGRLLDVDGDGLLDLVANGLPPIFIPGGGGDPRGGTGGTTLPNYAVRVWINHLRDGGGWVFSEDYSIKLLQPYKFNGTDRLVDINGDGLTDLFRFANGEVRLGRVQGGWEANPSSLYSVPHRITDGATPSSGFWTDVALFFEGNDSIGTLGHVVDVNNDGLADIILQKGSNSLDPNTKYDVWLNTGYAGGGQSPDDIWRRVAEDVSLPGMAANGDDIWMTDINGDGISDRYIFLDQNTGWASPDGTTWTGEWRVSDFVLGTGFSFVRKNFANPAFPPEVHPALGNRLYVDLTDLNGDGLPDLIWGDEDNAPIGPSRGVMLNQGIGFANGAANLPTMPMNAANGLAISETQRHNGTFLVDLDGDRLPEVVYAGTGPHSTWRNHGSPPIITKFPNQLTTIDVVYDYTTRSKPASRVTPLYTPEFGYRPNDRPSTVPMRVVDTVTRHSPTAGVDSTSREVYGYSGLRVSIRGRGLEGFHKVTVIDLERGTQAETEYAQAYPYTGRVLKVDKKWWGISVGSPEPGTPISLTTNTYCDNPDLTNDVGVSSCADQALGSTYGPETSLFVVPVDTTDISYLPNSSDTVTTTTKWKYDHAGNLKTTSVDVVGSNGQSTRKAITNTFGRETVDDWNWQHGRLTATETKSSADGAPDIVHRQAFIYDDITHRLQEKQEEPGALPPLEVHTVFAYDDYGNTTVTTVCADDWAGCKAGANTRYHRTATVSFDPNEFAPFIPPGSGLIARLTYPAGLFPVKSTNALGHTEYSAFDPYRGVLLQKTGPNGLTTRQIPDGLGRVVEVVERAGTLEPLVTTTNMYRVSQAVAGGPQTVTIAHAPTGVLTFTYADALGRVVETKHRGFDGAFVSVATEYDVLGRTHRTSEPSTISPLPFWTTTELDGLDRVISVTKDVGDLDGSGRRSTTVTTVRSGFTTSTTQSVTLQTGAQPAAVVKTEARDARGLTIAAFDGGTRTVPPVETDFVYDAEGRLTDTRSSATSLTLAHTVYDLRGRKIVSDDPDMGHWEYTYTGFGELDTQTDARGQTVKHEYDALGRLVRRTTTDTAQVSKTASWYYDTAPGAGIGKLAAMEGDDDDRLAASCPIDIPNVSTSPGNRPTRWFKYGYYGELLEQFDCVDGETFSTRNSYDPFGRADTVTYPSVDGQRFTLRYFYNPSGYLQAAADPAEPTNPYWVAREQDERGEFKREVLRNGVETTRVRNLATGWLLKQTDVARQTGSRLLQNSTYTYNEVGSLLSRARNDALSGLSETFGYDVRDRLTFNQATGPGGAVVSADSPGYDDLGNITSKNGRTFHYGTCQAEGRSAGIHALCQIDDGPLNVYDANGNLRRDATHSVEFNVGNKVSQITRLPSDTQPVQAMADYVYGADGQRVMQSVVDGSGEAARTLYVGLDNVGKAFYERTTRGTKVEHTHYLFAGGNAFGLRVVTTENSASKTDLKFYHTDHLGSVVAVSNEAGEVSNESATNSSDNLSYDAWGSRRNPDGSRVAPSEWSETAGRRGFTGHELVTALALVNMNGRIYDPELGRFLSPDPEVQFAKYLQSYNRYSYVLNNPLRYTDPTGYRLRPEEARFLQHLTGVATAVACAVNPYACYVAVGVSIAVNSYVMNDQGVSTGRIIGMTAFSTAVSIASAGVGSAVGGAVASAGASGAAASMAQGAASSATQAAITSAVFERGNLGQNVLVGAMQGAVKAGLSYGFQLVTSVSETEYGGYEEARRLARLGKASGEAMRSSSSLTTIIEEVARDNGPHPYVADNQSGTGSSLADVPFCNMTPCEVPPMSFGQDMSQWHLPPLHYGVTTFTVGLTCMVPFGLLPVGGFSLSVGIAVDQNGGFAFISNAGMRGGVQWGLSGGITLANYPELTHAVQVGGTYTQANLDTPFGSFSHSPQMTSFSPPLPFTGYYRGVSVEAGYTGVLAPASSYLTLSGR